MKLTIIGPEKDVVRITKEGIYELGKDMRDEMFKFGYSYASIYGMGKRPKVIAREHASISRHHLEISIDEEMVTLTDKGSENKGSRFGSFLNGRKFKERILKKPGKYNLKLGNANFKLNYEK